MGEEQNLYGSKAYVAAHEHELDDVVAVVNVDMPGSPRKFGTFGHPEIVDFLKSVRAQLRGYEIAEEVGNHSGSWSDHAPFTAAGVCAVALWGDIGEGGKTYHTTKDKYDVVDRRKTIQFAAALGVLVRQLADCPERPTQRLGPSER
jgi:Zn-dependent M28 family amino/carboxypeptidase